MMVNDILQTAQKWKKKTYLKPEIMLCEILGLAIFSYRTQIIMWNT